MNVLTSQQSESGYSNKVAKDIDCTTTACTSQSDVHVLLQARQRQPTTTKIVFLQYGYL